MTGCVYTRKVCGEADPVTLHLSQVDLRNQPVPTCLRVPWAPGRAVGGKTTGFHKFTSSLRGVVSPSAYLADHSSSRPRLEGIHCGV